MASEEQNNSAIKEESVSLSESQESTDSNNKKDDEYSEPIYIKVAEDENEEAVELPCEEDNSILLSTLTSQFPGASGLKYRNPDTNSMRGLRLADGKFIAPEKGWNAFSPYFCVFPRDFKRKLDDDNEKSKKSATSKSKCSDLIVLGLPWKITEDELKEYFEQFGETVMVQIKKDPKSGQSKGFGFVKFSDYDVQMRVVAKRHNISGRWCDVRVPLSKGEEQFSYQSSEFNRKIFVGRIPEEFTCDDLRNYFKKFGEISDVFIPKPFRAFAFITFTNSEAAQTICGEDHIINGISVHVSNAVPKVDYNASSNYNQSSFHSTSNHQSNYSHHSHHNQSRYNPYHHKNGGGQQQDLRFMRRQQQGHQHRNHHQFNNPVNNSMNNSMNNTMHSNGNPLVNTNFNPHPMTAIPNSMNSIWTNSLGAHVSNGGRTDLPPMPVQQPPAYGMPLTQKHYGQH